MWRTIASGIALTALVSWAGRSRADEALTKAIELGILGEHFLLVSADKTFDPSRGGTIALKLQATKDVDTSLFFLKAGFFDKDNHMHLAAPVRFDAGFPLKKGETIRVEIWEGRTPQKWHKIAIRKVEKPVPRSEYHYQ